MRSRLAKRLDSKYCTAFDVAGAAASIRGMMYLAPQGSCGVISIIRIDESSDIHTINDSKHLLFVEKEDDGTRVFATYEGTSDDGSFCSFDSFTKVLARRLKFSKAQSSVIICLDIYDYAEGMEFEDILAQGKKEHFSWYAEEFIIHPVDFTKSAVSVPPGCSFVNGQLTEDEDHQGALFGAHALINGIEQNEADAFLHSLLEYSYNGAHSFSAVWQKEDGEIYGDSTFFVKNGEDIGLILTDDIIGGLEYQLFIDNIQHRMENGEKTYILLNSVVTEGTVEGDPRPSELRAWELKGQTIHSLDDRALKVLVQEEGKDFFKVSNTILCDSWDYPVTRHDDNGL